ncbi:MAG TPA: response regulator, partial [Pyrinomonadaceae bacterium]|nr:response regulator [Pyrinomonadaceae bacterium]
MKVLIAEDEPDSRQLLQIMVGRWGYEPTPVCDGLEAWEALQQEDAPPLALLDIMMPHMDGLEVCRRAKERQTVVPLYIIMLTAKTLPKEIVSGL